MEGKYPAAMVNPVSLLGAVMAIFSLVIVLVLLVLGATGAIASPYTGILTFLVGPAILTLGLLLIPIGVLRERRRLARLGLVAKAFPILDLNDSRQRRGLAIFAGVTAGILSLMAVTTYGAAEFMETKEFCGDVCHRVMEPEGAAYEASSHARVSCVSCHIGPGAPWLVKSKISGIRQVFSYSLGLYSRPIEVPIQDLRPSRDTCEQCHRPERFYGDLQRNIVHYAQDEQNTPKVQPMIFRVGGSARGEGIHWHTTAKVYYLPLNESRSEIGWVRVEKPDGTVDEFALPDRQAEVTPQRIEREERFMDCIDCHNRTAHHFAPVQEEVDRAMLEGRINSKIPFIKQQVMQAVGEIGQSISEEEYREALGRIDSIDAFYRIQQPQVYAEHQAEIGQAVAEAKRIYQRTVFPHMRVTPSTYPDWVGHDGCMRCHGKLVGIQGEAKGRTIGADCQTCHYLTQPAPPAPAPVASAAQGAPAQSEPAPAQQPPASPAQQATGDQQPSGAPVASTQGQPSAPTAIPNTPHPTQGREQCSTCHTAGGPGVGATGGLGMPDNHQDRPDGSCLSCHKAA